MRGRSCVGYDIVGLDPLSVLVGAIVLTTAMSNVVSYRLVIDADADATAATAIAVTYPATGSAS
jgi:hypothetical protein